MISRLLGVVLVLGCASGRHPAPAPQDSTATEPPAVDLTDECRRGAAVTVHVENRSSLDVEITFGPYAPGRAAQGMSNTTYRVPRPYLLQSIWLRARGGLQTEGAAEIRTEPVSCNDATLIIGTPPSHSFFYGDLIEAPAPRRKHDDTVGVSSTQT